MEVFDGDMQALLKERWCARALVSLCLDDASNVPVWLPQMSTVCALLCGMYAVLAASASQIYAAMICIVLSVFFDLLDGKLVQMFGARSQFGAQYSALSDTFAFGIAPAILMYNSLLVSAGVLGLFATFCYIIAAGIRHTRQVTTPESSRFVRGLPSNLAALLVVAVVATSTRSACTIPFSEAAGVVASLLCAFGMASEMKQRNYLPDFNLQEAGRALALVSIGTLVASVLPPQPVMCATAVLWAAIVFKLKEKKELVAIVTLIAVGFAALLALSDGVLPRDDAMGRRLFIGVMVVWFPFTRVATFASFLKVKKAQKLLVTHWVRHVTGVDFHHFHLGAGIILLAIVVGPCTTPGSSRYLAVALLAIGLSYVLDQAAPVLVKTFGKDKDCSQRRCLACDRANCPWRWGSRGLCYFAREATVAAAALHAAVIWYVSQRV